MKILNIIKYKIFGIFPEDMTFRMGLYRELKKITKGDISFLSTDIDNLDKPKYKYLWIKIGDKIFCSKIDGYLNNLGIVQTSKDGFIPKELK